MRRIALRALFFTLVASLGFIAGERWTQREQQAKTRESQGNSESVPKSGSDEENSRRTRMESFPTVVVATSKLPDFSASPYQDWRMKIRCRGIKGDLKRDFFAEVQCVKHHQPLETAALKKGMRVLLEMVPVEEAPPSTREWPLADDVDDFSLPVFWVRHLEHDEPELKLAREPGRERFSHLAIETVLKSRVAVPSGAEESPFYFYGANWAIYKAEAEGRLTGSQSGSPMTAVLHLHEWLKKRGVHLVFAPIPQSASIFPDVGLGHFDGTQLKAAAANSSVRFMLDELRREGVAVIDFSEVMGPQRMEIHEERAYPIYLPNDTHWASGGAAMAAKACADLLLHNKLVEPGRRDLFTVEKVPDTHAGDLNLASAVANLQVTIPPVPTLLHKVIASSEEALQLLADPGSSAEVHCAGDSYLFAHRDQHAGFVDHLVRETGLPVHVTAGNASAQRVALRAWLRNSSAGKAKVLLWMPAERFLGFDEWLDVEKEPAAKR